MTAVVLGDGAASVERTGEGGFTLHAASIEFNCQLVHYPFKTLMVVHISMQGQKEVSFCFMLSGSKRQSCQRISENHKLTRAASGTVHLNDVGKS